MQIESRERTRKQKEAQRGGTVCHSERYSATVTAEAKAAP